MFRGYGICENCKTCIKYLYIIIVIRHTYVLILVYQTGILEVLYRRKSELYDTRVASTDICDKDIYRGTDLDALIELYGRRSLYENSNVRCI